MMKYTGMLIMWYELVMKKKLNYKLNMKLIMLTEEALVNMPKNEVDVNIDDSLD